MPSNISELPPVDESPKPDLKTWFNIRQYFLDQRAALVELRENKGPEAADLAQKEMARGLDDMDAWEQMFAEGQWRQPGAAKVIEEARAAFCRFLSPVVTREEEVLKELRGIKQELLAALRQLESGEKSQQALNLKKIFERVERFGALAQSSEEISGLVNQIMSTIGRLARSLRK